MTTHARSLFKAAKTTPNRVCVVGGGISGLTTAYELTRIGYEVTVLERTGDIGGMTTTLDLDGHPYDLGGHLVSNTYYALRALLNELGLATETTPKAYFISDPTGKTLDYAEINRQFAGLVGEFETAKKRLFPEINKPGFVNVSHKLYQPVKTWIDKNMPGVPYELLQQLFAGAGYGFATTLELPVMYLFKFLQTVDFVGDVISAVTVAGGLKVLYNKLADEVGDVRCGVEIQRVERSADGVKVTTQNETMDFDYIVFAMPLNKTLPFLDATPEETTLFSKIEYLDYYTTVCSIKNIPRQGLYFLGPNLTTEEVGQPMAYYHQHADTDVCVIYSYGSADVGGDVLVDKIKSTFEKMGGEFVSLHHQQRWNYFAHVPSEDVRSGYYVRLEALQGQSRTFYTGALFNFELMECNVAYAQDMVRQHFTPLNDQAPRESYEALLQPAASSTAPGTFSQADIQDRIVTLFAKALDVPKDEIHVDRPVSDFGIESLKLVEIFRDISLWLGTTVVPAIVIEAPTLAAIVERLAGDRSKTTAPVASISIPASEVSRLKRFLHTPSLRPFFAPFHKLALFAMGLIHLVIYNVRRGGDLKPLSGLMGDWLYFLDDSLLEFDPYTWHHFRVKWFGGKRQMYLALNQVFVVGDYNEVKALLNRPQQKTGTWLGYVRFEENDFRLKSPLAVSVSDDIHDQFRPVNDHIVPDANDTRLQAKSNTILVTLLDELASQVKQGVRSEVSIPRDTTGLYLRYLHELIYDMSLTSEEAQSGAIYIQDGVFIASVPARFAKDQDKVLEPFVAYRRHILLRYKESARIQQLMAPFAGKFPEMVLLNGLFDLVHMAGVPGLTLGTKGFIGSLLQHPHLLKMAKDEVTSLWNGQGVPPVDQFAMLNKILLEALRLYPPVWASSQMAQEHSSTSALGISCPIKPETQLTSSIWLSGQDKKFFGADADQFNPHRDHSKLQMWNDFNAMRICPAKELSIIVSKTLAAHLIMNYEWDGYGVNEMQNLANNDTQVTLQGFRKRS